MFGFNSYGGNVVYMLLLCAIFYDLNYELSHCGEVGHNRKESAILMLRLLAVSHIFAFTSIYVQIEGLCGQQGLIPVTRSLGEIWRTIENVELKFSDVTLHLHVLLLRITTIMLAPPARSDRNLKYFVLSGCIVACIGVVFPLSSVFAYLFLSYYSIRRATHTFTDLQWDALLLEASVSAVLLATAISLNNPLLICMCNWLFKMLLFRLMFGSGYVKLMSGDVAWIPSGGFTAMTYHFLTQPLPNRMSSTMHRLPKVVLQILTFGTMLVELAVPQLSWVSNSMMQEFAAASFIFLMVSIAMSGNFGFFNFFSAALSLSLCHSGSVSIIRGIVLTITGDITDFLVNLFALKFAEFEYFLMRVITRTAVKIPEIAIIVTKTVTTTVVETTAVTATTAAETVLTVYQSAILYGIPGVINNIRNLRLSDSSKYDINAIKSILQDNIQTLMETISSNISAADLILRKEYADFISLPPLQFCAASVYGIKYGTVFFFAVLMILSNINALKILFNRGKTEVTVGTFLPSIFKWSHLLMSPLLVGTHYGLFARMTKTRKEVIIEVSDNCREWHPVVFAFKPCITSVPPIAIWPPCHMPRVDWRLWFLALIPTAVPRWFYTFLIGILEGNQSILGLLHSEANEHLTKEGKADMCYRHNPVGVGANGGLGPTGTGPLGFLGPTGTSGVLGPTGTGVTGTSGGEQTDNIKTETDNMKTEGTEATQGEFESIWNFIRVSVYDYTYADNSDNNNNNGNNGNGNGEKKKGLASPGAVSTISNPRTGAGISAVSSPRSSTGTGRVSTGTDSWRRGNIVEENDRLSSEALFNDEVEQYWKATFLAEIIPPTQLDDLYIIRDNVKHCELSEGIGGNKGNKGGNEKSSPPKPDTAAELITRNFKKAFAKMKAK